VSSLAGKAALVTGAGGGIGSAVCLALAAEGVRVLGVDRDEGGVPAGEAIDRYVAELTDETQVAGAVAAAADRFGRLDVVFNGAGISGRRLGDGRAEDIPLEAWETVMSVNLTSMFLVCKHAIRALRASGGGSIVNLSSVLGLVGGDEDFATHAYAASKGGIVAFTRSLATTYASEGIAANVVCPGLIATPMSARAQMNERIRARLPELQPLTGEFGEPRDVAEAVVYLAGSRFVTGAVLPVDGGWTAR
jgi:meso-butanediol dehydrogenase / (S,S)-butanediol dehydrogenase / diacetyl reductase